MGVKISKRYSCYKSQPKVFKLFLNFLPNGPHKSTVLDFLNFELTLDTNRKLYMVIPKPPSHLTLSDLERSKLKH